MHRVSLSVSDDELSPARLILEGEVSVVLNVHLYRTPAGGEDLVKTLVVEVEDARDVQVDEGVVHHVTKLSLREDIAREVDDLIVDGVLAAPEKIELRERLGTQREGAVDHLI